MRDGAGVSLGLKLSHGPVGLRIIRQRDMSDWREVRIANYEWLRPWEATMPPEAGTAAPTFSSMVRQMRADARAGRMLPFVVTYDGRLVGQVTVGGIVWGSLRSGYVGYWVDRRYAGRGIIPVAVALAADYCMDELRLHRLEINIRPENVASRRVVEKLGFEFEGARPRYLHIDGDWRDHHCYVHSRETRQARLLEVVQAGTHASDVARTPGLSAQDGRPSRQVTEFRRHAARLPVWRARLT